MVLAVHVGRVDAGLLEGGVNGLLDLLFLGLLDGDLLLVLKHLGRAVRRGDGDGVHGCDLHHDTLGEVCGDFLVEAHEGAELAVERVDVLDHEGSLHERIVCEHVLLAGLAGLGLDGLGDGVAVRHLAGLQALDVGRAVRDRDVGDGVGQILEIGVAGDEVGLAAEADEDRLAAGHAGLHRTLGSLAVGALGGHELTLLADDADGLLEVAFGFLKGLLAVHHAGGGHLPELHYICCSNCHIAFCF